MDEVFALDIYSRKVQYGDQIIDLSDIQTHMTFAESQNFLSAYEVGYIASTSHSGVFLVMQNQTYARISISDATFTGVRFNNIRTVLPGGVGIGSGVSEIAHAQSGAFGVPSYCLGTPLIGFGLESTTLVYLDRSSGDRVSFHFDAEDAFVRMITYEFSKYE